MVYLAQAYRDGAVQEQAPPLETARNILAFILIKYMIRKSFHIAKKFNVFSDENTRDRTMFLLEHIIFSIWGYYCIVVLPSHQNSWFYRPELIWQMPLYQSQLFSIFYLAKVGTHVEDMIFLAGKWYRSAKDKHTTPSTAGAVVVVTTEKKSDLMMDIHHISTAALCLLSYYFGYVKIGSLVMLLHDISDVPLDFLQLFRAVKLDTLMIISYICTLPTWVYWRLWILSALVIRTIVEDSESLTCSYNTAEECLWHENCERVLFIGLLGSLWILHIIWFYKLIKLGYRELVGGGGGSSSSNSSSCSEGSSGKQTTGK